MKTISPDLSAHLASGTTTLAWCWRVTRVDGAVFGFTDHDLGLAFDGTDFEPQAGMIPSEIRSSSDLAVDAQDAEGVLS
ncbi:baseplate hub protein, partial [Celeribacter halophilus]